MAPYVSRYRRIWVIAYSLVWAWSCVEGRVRKSTACSSCSRNPSQGIPGPFSFMRLERNWRAFRSRTEGSRACSSVFALHELNAVNPSVDELLHRVDRRTATDERGGQFVEGVDLRCVRLRHVGFVHDLLPKYLSIGSVG